MAFQKSVHNFDPPLLPDLFHSKTISFESRSWNLESDVEYHLQWSSIVPSSNFKFSFLMQDAKVIPAPGMFVVAIKGMTIGNMIGCEPSFHQLTFVLCDFEGKLLGTHSHVSPCPG